MGISASAVLTTSDLSDYLNVKVEPIYTESALMEGLKSHGRIVYKKGGTDFKWRPKIIRRKITAGNPYNVLITFPSRNTRIEVTLPWVMYHLGEKLVKYDRLANENDPRKIVKLAQDILDGMADDFVTDFATKLYTDGGATGSQDLHGFEAMMSYSGVSGYMCVNNDTYAGKSTALAGLGGDWTGTWPQGTGDSEYAAWTPMIWDYTSASWTDTTNNWSHNWQEVLGMAMTYMRRNQKVIPDIVMLSSELYEQAAYSLKDQERFIATPAPKSASVGFKKFMYRDLEIIHEYNCTAACGYMFRWKDIELRSMQAQLVGNLKDTKIETGGEELFAMDFYGNLRFECPAFFAKFISETSGSTP